MSLCSNTACNALCTAHDATGQLTGINYSDSSPDVTFAYDRLGRMTSATTPASTNLFGYSGLDLVTETQNGVTITRSYDNLGRSAGFNMGSAYIAAYGYDTFGRFASVSSSVATASSVANYSYVTGSSLVASMTNSSGFSWSRVYEQNRASLRAWRTPSRRVRSRLMAMRMTPTAGARSASIQPRPCPSPTRSATMNGQNAVNGLW